MIKREIIFSNRSDALLQVIPFFTIKRCPENFPRPPYDNGHQPYFFNYTVPKVSQKKGIISTSYLSNKKPNFNDYQLVGVEGEQAQVDTTSKKYREILTLINTLSRDYFFHYNQQEAWFITTDENHEMHYGQEFYRAPDFEKQTEEFEKLPFYSIADPGYFNITLSPSQSLDINLKNLFDAYYECEDITFKSEFLNSALVLCKAFRIRKVDHSASYLMMVSAIEALIQIEYKDQKVETCTSCTQKIYESTKKFRKFLDDYGFESDKKVKNKFYDMRSRITHNGTLLGMSYDSKWVIENQEDLNKDYQRFIDKIWYDRFEELAKTCFRYFLIVKTGHLEKLVEQYTPDS